MTIITTLNIKSVNFYQMPKALIQNTKYINLSANSKLAYMILKDKLSMSIQNNWIEDDGRIFVKMSRQTLVEQMGISINTATKIFKELVENELIVEENTKVKKVAKKIYICEVEETEVVVKKKNKKQYNDEFKKTLDSDGNTPIDGQMSIYDMEVNEPIIEMIASETGFTNEESKELLEITSNNIGDIFRYYRYTLQQSNVKSIYHYTKKCIMGKFKIPRDPIRKKGLFNNYEQRTYDFGKLEMAMRGECSISEAMVY